MRKNKNKFQDVQILSYAAKLSDNLSLSASWYRNDFARNWFKLNKVNGAKLSTIAGDPSSDGWADFYALMDATESADDAYRVKANNREYISKGIQTKIDYHWYGKNKSF